MYSSEVSDLSKRIRDSANTGVPVDDTLSTSQRIIARVTDGIYREPWAAFRELVANAYDADATRVIVETGAPEFSQVSIRDDGNGMSPDVLAYLVKNIGGSSKRTTAGEELQTTKRGAPDLSPGGRPLIGKIGIGLFAVAQLTQHFQIVTKAPGELFRTSATIKLRTHEEESVANSDDENRYVAGEVSFTSEKVPDNEIETHGTVVVLYSLREEIRRNLQSVGRWTTSIEKGDDGRAIRDAPKYHIGRAPQTLSSDDIGLAPHLPWADAASPQEKFASFFAAAADIAGRGTKPANLEHFDDYLRLVWNLSLSLPLQYVNHHPFLKTGSCGVLFYGIPTGEKQATKLAVPAKATLRDYLSLSSGGPDPAGGFAVVLDGIELKRPIDLPDVLRKSSRISAPAMLVANVGPAFKNKDLERSGGQLRFEAYLYWNSQLVPKDTSGVIVRIREASGTLFDPDFLRYQVSEQTRLGQITAEILVTEGLDPAINIDRESFNYSHPHFVYIQKWLHRALRLLVNRLKALAEADLEEEKRQRKKQNEEIVIAAAVNVWNDRRGESADRPLPEEPPLVGQADIAGTPVDLPSTTPDAMALAIAVVLESYGVLSSLTLEERSALVADLLAVMRSAT